MRLRSKIEENFKQVQELAKEIADDLDCLRGLKYYTSDIFDVGARNDSTLAIVS